MDNNIPEITEKLSLINLFGASFIIASMAGLARLLRSYPTAKSIPLRLYLSAILNSGVLGLIVALLWYKVYSDNITFLIGVSALAGAGGITVVDFFITFLSNKMGIKISLFSKESKED